MGSRRECKQGWVTLVCRLQQGSQRLVCFATAVRALPQRPEVCYVQVLLVNQRVSRSINCFCRGRYRNQCALIATSTGQPYLLPLYVVGLHNTVMRVAAAAHAGHVIEQEGDSWSVAFHTGMDAVAFCLQVRPLQPVSRLSCPAAGGPYTMIEHL